MTMRHGFQVGDTTDASDSDSDLDGRPGDLLPMSTDGQQSRLRLQWLRLQVVELQRMAHHYTALKKKRETQGHGSNEAQNGDILEVGDDALLRYSHDYPLRKFRKAARAAASGVKRVKRSAKSRWREKFVPKNNVVSTKSSMYRRLAPAPAPIAKKVATPCKPLRRNSSGLLSSPGTPLRGPATPHRGPATPIRTPKRHDDFSIDDMVLPFAWQNRHQVIPEVKVKEITTPCCRKSTERVEPDDCERADSYSKTSTPGGDSALSKASTPGEDNTYPPDSSEEDTSDEAYITRHAVEEEREIKKRMPALEKKQREAAARRADPESYNADFTSINIGEGSSAPGTPAGTPAPSTPGRSLPSFGRKKHCREGLQRGIFLGQSANSVAATKS
eukprot:CAMPEP_0114552610 /NCGR_PEP_ID=MMETSP0114-20121206/7214_1 /TAXON_ID=31324 /ORGANISM="Goniomonas sp, Strain m" /LENGTH=387 /DNA_ID=CAMNT_0001737493 /DNA_START=103 /DNA_END=1266 /DNA_ORIENTATION=-